jgi:hypothetical protein
MINSLTARHIASVQAPEIDGSYQGWSPCLEWLHENDLPYVYVGEGVFEFESQADRLVFMLRWS